MIGGFSLFFMSPAPENCGVCGIEKIIQASFGGRARVALVLSASSAGCCLCAGTAVQRHEGDQRRWVEGFFAQPLKVARGRSAQRMRMMRLLRRIMTAGSFLVELYLG